MEDFLAILRDSVETSVSMGLFETRQEALYAHVYSTKTMNLSFAKIRRLNKFNPVRLQKTADLAYPPHDRPRGAHDLSSVQHYVSKIRRGHHVPPIWVMRHKGKLVLLDGAHRIVAHYIAKKRSICALVIIT